MVELDECGCKDHIDIFLLESRHLKDLQRSGYVLDQLIDRDCHRIHGNEERVCIDDF